MLNFSILIDNRITSELEGRNKLHTEHGLSIYIEYNKTKILCDTGATELFMQNAEVLGIDPTESNFCFISHGHSDHTGGLLKFLQETTEKCTVYLSGQIKGSRFYSCRREKKREISPDAEIFGQYGNRLEYICGSRWLTPEIAAVETAGENFGKPAGNSFLTMERDGIEQPDDFTHELALAIKTNDGLVVFSPCTHNGLLNVTESCLEFTGSSKLRAFIGGLHFIDGCENAKDIEATADTFMERYPNAQLYTSHCTGESATAVLAGMMPDHIFKVFGTGENFSL